MYMYMYMHGYTLTLLKCPCTLASIHVEYSIICLSFPAGTSTCLIYIQTIYIYTVHFRDEYVHTHKFTSMCMAICIYLYICEHIFFVVKMSSYMYLYIYIHIYSIHTNTIIYI